jgi:GntR family transcriptional regulator
LILSSSILGVGRELRYLAVRQSLRELLSSGEYSTGALLPSESELAARYGTSRVTLRKALGTLKDEGLIDSRQGFGWFAVTRPLRQSLDALTTIDAQITAGGRRAHRKLVGFSLRPAPPWVAEILATDQVLEITRLNLADDEPLGRNTAWVPAALAADISLTDIEQHSLHDLLPVRIARATQVITAVGATAEDAARLTVPTNSPLLRCERATYDHAGTVVLVSEALYNPLRTEFIVELPKASPDTTGLRLVNGDQLDSAAGTATP